MRLIKFIVVLFLMVFSLNSFASSWFTRGGAVNNGYDSVSYFTEGKAVKGSKEHSLNWDGAVWLFSSEENKQKFTANPEKYAPQYHGYCAYGVASGYKVKVKPDLWTIIDDKLYLNYDDNVQKKWLKDPKAYIQKADKRWPNIK